MKGSTIHRSSNHIDERSRMIVVIALLCELLFKEIRVERTRFRGDSRGYMNVLSRRHHGRLGLENPCVFSTINHGRCRDCRPGGGQSVKTRQEKPQIIVGTKRLRNCKKGNNSSASYG